MFNSYSPYYYISTSCGGKQGVVFIEGRACHTPTQEGRIPKVPTYNHRSYHLPVVGLTTCPIGVKTPPGFEPGQLVWRVHRPPYSTFCSFSPYSHPSYDSRRNRFFLWVSIRYFNLFPSGMEDGLRFGAILFGLAHIGGVIALRDLDNLLGCPACSMI